MIFCQRAVPGILKSSPQAFSPLSIPPPLGAPIVLTKSCDAASGNEKSFKTFCNDDDICAAKKLNVSNLKRQYSNSENNFRNSFVLIQLKK